MTTFITSDTHFGHANIIKHCSRPFHTATDMDEALIKNWNDAIGPEDTVWHLGDFAYRGHQPARYFHRLNGRKHLIVGNHDHEATEDLPWETVQSYAEISENGRLIVLFHYPILSWKNSNHGSIHLHGHQHNLTPLQAKNRIDIGVDAHEYRPWTLSDVLGLAV